MSITPRSRGNFSLGFLNGPCGAESALSTFVYPLIGPHFLPTAESFSWGTRGMNCSGLYLFTDLYPTGRAIETFRHSHDPDQSTDTVLSPLVFPDKVPFKLGSKQSTYPSSAEAYHCGVLIYLDMRPELFPSSRHHAVTTMSMFSLDPAG